MVENQIGSNPLIAQLKKTDKSVAPRPVPEKKHSIKNLALIGVALLGLSLLDGKANAQTSVIDGENTEDKINLCPPDVQINMPEYYATGATLSGSITLSADHEINTAVTIWEKGDDTKDYQPDPIESNNKQTVIYLDHVYPEPGDKNPVVRFMKDDKIQFICKGPNIPVYGIYSWELPQSQFNILESQNNQEFKFNANTDLPAEIREKYGNIIIGLVTSPGMTMNGRGGNREIGDFASLYVNGQESWGVKNLGSDNNPNDDSIDWYSASGSGEVFISPNLDARTSEVTFGVTRPNTTYINGVDVTSTYPPKLEDVSITGRLGIWYMPDQRPKLFPILIPNPTPGPITQ